MLTREKKQLDLEKLPEEVRKEIIDFYEFLISRYSYEKEWDKTKLPEEFYSPLIRNKYFRVKREEIYNDV